ncbi:MAG: Hsp20/alpha crystallin family protein [Halobacteriales archaeon]|nr:Hsp20/alpha crystallin family protein [Halobacteriales archaeon]
MALPTTASSWIQNLDLPSQLFELDGTDYELFEEDDEFVLSVEMPGFESDEIDVSWYEGRLTISADHEDDMRDMKRTYHRTFRMPKEIDPDGISAEYTNGVLEVRLPVLAEEGVRGTSIPIES